MALPYQCTATLERMHVLVTEGSMGSKPKAAEPAAEHTGRRRRRGRNVPWWAFLPLPHAPAPAEPVGLEDLPVEVLQKVVVDSDKAQLMARTSKHLQGVFKTPGAALKGARLPFRVKCTSYITPETTTRNQRKIAMLHDLERRSTEYTLTSIDVRHFELVDKSLVFPRTDPRVESLAASLRKCPALETLTLKYTGVTDWTDIGNALANCTQLERVHIEAGSIAFWHDRSTFEHVFRGIALSPHLTDLSFGKCDLREVSASLAALLPVYVALTRLDLSSNDLGTGNNGIAGFPVLLALAQCPRLQHLDLSSNQLFDDAGDALEVALPRCTSLTHLDLSRNRFRDLNNFLRSLSQLTRLRHLSLTHIHGLSHGALSNLFTQGGCALLTSLDVSYCNVWVSNHDEGSYQAPLVHCMSLCTNLTALRLAGNRLGDFVGHLLCTTVLPACTSLTLLDLADTRLSEHGVRDLAPKFKTCPKLVFLDLHNNNIDDEGKDQIRRRWDAVHVPEGLVL